MKRKFLMLFLFYLFVSSAGCTSSRGLIELYTRPRGAVVYLDEIKQGESPVRFEYDFKRPARLRIVKDGYYDEEELLNEAWVIREIRKGNYNEGRYQIGGVSTKSWTINTLRRMEEKKANKEDSAEWDIH